MKRSGHTGYLSEEFFQQLRQTMSDKLVVITAYRNEQPIAASLFIKGNNILYGRYWGAMEVVDGLHFECCYYQGIEYCIKEQINCLQPGTQGDYKRRRGFVPELIYGAYYFTLDGLQQPIQDYLDLESKHVKEKSGLFYGDSDEQRYKIIQWLMFQMSGVGPMMGQANVFFRYFPEKIQAAIDRYQNESKRLLTVLDTQLEKGEYLAGEYSIADIATWPWAKTHVWSGVEIDGLPNLQRWISLVGERPAVIKGGNLPPRAESKDIVKAGQTMMQK